MHRIALFPLLCAAAFAQSSPFVGRWDFSVPQPSGVGANWLGVTEKGGGLEVWYQPTGGHVFKVDNPEVKGSHMTLKISKTMTWDLNAAQKTGDKTTALTGVRAPALKHAEPKAWTTPVPLFNGKTLAGWEPIGDPSKSHWTVQDGMMVNIEHGANIKTTRKFEDFKVHFEVNCPEHANSGFYLRGRYETQLEYEPLDKNPPERRFGAIYGRIAPVGDLPRAPGTWETMDITLVGRTVTIVRNGVTTVDHKEIDGITGGALDANEGQPGPFYIQGDHTGGLKFRNLTVSVPKK
jgi:hypothetical protein